MSKRRTSLGFGDELESFDPAEWERSPEKTRTDRPEPSQTREIAKATGFTSREAATPQQSEKGRGAPQRRRRTGRNAQINIKARPETIEAFGAIADAQGWGLGETLEKAVELLSDRYDTEGETRNR